MLKTIAIAVTLALSGCAGTLDDKALQLLKDEGMPSLWVLINGATETYLADCNENPNTAHCKKFRETLLRFSAAYVAFNEKLEKVAK